MIFENISPGLLKELYSLKANVLYLYFYYNLDNTDLEQVHPDLFVQTEELKEIEIGRAHV